MTGGLVIVVASNQITILCFELWCIVILCLFTGVWMPLIFFTASTEDFVIPIVDLD